MRLIMTLSALLMLATNAAAESGHASWYGSEVCRKGRACKTANGERFRPGGMTVAHKSLPFGTKLRIHFPKTGKSIVVRVNDRGPFVRGRVLDLARGAADKIGLTRYGAGRVNYSIVK